MAEAVLTLGASKLMNDKHITYILMRNFRTEKDDENCLSFVLKNPDFVKAWEGLLKLCVLEYTNKVRNKMLEAGADISYVDEVVTEDEIKYAIANDINADDFAWGLMF